MNEPGADLEQANLTRADLTNAILVDAEVRMAFFYLLNFVINSILFLQG